MGIAAVIYAYIRINSCLGIVLNLKSLYEGS